MLSNRTPRNLQTGATMKTLCCWEYPRQQQRQLRWKFGATLPVRFFFLFSDTEFPILRTVFSLCSPDYTLRFDPRGASTVFATYLSEEYDSNAPNKERKNKNRILQYRYQCQNPCMAMPMPNAKCQTAKAMGAREHGRWEVQQHHSHQSK